MICKSTGSELKEAEFKMVCDAKGVDALLRSPPRLVVLLMMPMKKR